MYWGDTYAEKAMMRMSGKIKEIYAEAAQDINTKIQAYNQRFLKKDAEYRQKVADGKMTQAEYDRWKQGQVFAGKRWQSVRDDIEHQIYAANNTATDIVNGERQAVFVQNVNYAQYTIDKDFQFGLSFNLYDSATVTRLIRDDPDMLPAVGQDEHKTDEWTRKLVSSAITQGVIQGESIPKISKRIAEKLGSSNEKSMTRIARTAMTSAQNAGRIEAMHNAQGMGIDVQKMWISTLDNRTRDAHRNLDGQVQNVDDPFISDLGNIMFPGDPNAAPANVWRCRCTLGWEYPEYQRTNAVRAGRTYDEDGNPTGWEDVPEMTYRQWEQWKRGEYVPEPTRTLSPEEQIAEMLKDRDVDIYKVGKLFAEIMHEKLIVEYDQTEYDRLIREANDIKYGYDYTYTQKAKEAMGNIRLNVFQHNLSDISPTQIINISEGLTSIGWSNLKIDVMFMRKIQDGKFSWQEWSKINDALSRAIDKKDAEIKELRRKADMMGRTRSGTESAKILKETLSNFRKVGAEGLDLKSHLNNSRSPMRKIVEEAYDYYPTDWIKQSIARGNLTPQKVDRGYYDDYGKVIAISQYGDRDSSVETAIHELGHRYERAVPEIRKEEKLFYDRRTSGEDLKWLGDGYEKSEVTRKDNFVHPYMGKDYRGQAYELVSMGFEYAYMKPERLQQDEDMESWIYGLLLTK